MWGYKDMGDLQRKIPVELDFVYFAGRFRESDKKRLMGRSKNGE